MRTSIGHSPNLNFRLGEVVSLAYNHGGKYPEWLVNRPAEVIQINQESQLLLIKFPPALKPNTLWVLMTEVERRI